MKCPKCGSNIAGNSLFCKYCGFRIPQKPKYIRSQGMKNSMHIMFIGLGLFAIGLILVPIIIPLGIVSVGLGIVGLVGGSIAYLIEEFKKRKDEDAMSYTHVTPLPMDPVVISPHSHFIYPDIQPLKAYFENATAKGSNDGFVSIMFNHSVVAQIIDCPNKGKTHDIGIFFFPYLYEDRNLIERFADNYYMDIFAYNAIDSEEGVDAYFGTDIQSALQVVSYILANVYYIPTNSKLQLDCANI